MGMKYTERLRVAIGQRFEEGRANGEGWGGRGHGDDELERYILPQPGPTSVPVLASYLLICIQVHTRDSSGQHQTGICVVNPEFHNPAYSDECL